MKPGPQPVQTLMLIATRAKPIGPRSIGDGKIAKLACILEPGAVSGVYVVLGERRRDARGFLQEPENSNRGDPCQRN